MVDLTKIYPIIDKTVDEMIERFRNPQVSCETICNAIRDSLLLLDDQHKWRISYPLSYELSNFPNRFSCVRFLFYILNKKSIDSDSITNNNR